MYTYLRAFSKLETIQVNFFNYMMKNNNFYFNPAKQMAVLWLFSIQESLKLNYLSKYFFLISTNENKIHSSFTFAESIFFSSKCSLWLVHIKICCISSWYCIICDRHFYWLYEWLLASGRKETVISLLKNRSGVSPSRQIFFCFPEVIFCFVLRFESTLWGAMKEI